MQRPAPQAQQSRLLSVGMEKKMETTIVYWGCIGIPFKGLSGTLQLASRACLTRSWRRSRLVRLIRPVNYRAAAKELGFSCTLTVKVHEFLEVGPYVHHTT